MKNKFLKKHGKSSVLGTAVGFVNGLLGSGGGTILVPFLERYLDVEEHEAHATAISVILPLSVISSMVYIKSGVIDWSSLMYVAIGGTVGGLVGAKLLGRIPAKWLHRIFGAVMIIAAVRMLMS